MKIRTILVATLLFSLLMMGSANAVQKRAGGITLEIIPGEKATASIGLQLESYPTVNQARLFIGPIYADTILSNGTKTTENMPSPVREYFIGPELVDFDSSNMKEIIIEFEFPKDVNVTELTEKCAGKLEVLTDDRDAEGRRIPIVKDESVCMLIAQESLKTESTEEGDSSAVFSREVAWNIYFKEGEPKIVKQEITSTMIFIGIGTILLLGTVAYLSMKKK